MHKQLLASNMQIFLNFTSERVAERQGKARICFHVPHKEEVALWDIGKAVAFPETYEKLKLF